MSEQKYYVKLKPSISVIVEHDDQDNEIEFGYGYLNGLHEFSPLTPGNTFTKSELEDVMNGGLYKRADYCEFMELPPDWVMNDKTDKWLCEWINPLIELVKIEEED